MVPFAIALISRPFLGIILWLLVMPFIGMLPNPEMMYWLFHRILIVLVLALTIINNRWRETGKHVQLKPPDIAVLTLVGFVPILIIASQTDLYLPLIHGVDRILIPLLIYISIRLNPLDEQDNEAPAMDGAVCRHQPGSDWINVNFCTRSSCRHALQAYRQGYASGTLANPNVYAIALVFCALLLFQSAMKRKPGWVRYLFLLACGLCVIGVFFSMERAAWLSLALVLLGLLWIYPKPMIRILLVGGIVIVGLLAAGFLSKYIGSASDRTQPRTTGVRPDRGFRRHDPDGEGETGVRLGIRNPEYEYHAVLPDVGGGAHRARAGHLTQHLSDDPDRTGLDYIPALFIPGCLVAGKVDPGSAPDSTRGAVEQIHAGCAMAGSVELFYNQQLSGHALFSLMGLDCGG